MLLLILGAREALASEVSVWIDTDAACDGSAHHDPDDCFAILHLLRMPGVVVEGISTTFGNSERETADEVLRQLLGADPVAAAVPAWSGALEPGDCETEGTAALRAALRDTPRLQILALGPLTNVACALRTSPAAARTAAKVIAVMGARPGHVFHPAEERSRDALLGHGPVFTDLNLEKDPMAAKLLLDAGVPLVLVPYEAARRREIGREELSALAVRAPATTFVSLRARSWLDFWIATTGRDGFYPFDLVAAAYLSGAIPFECVLERVEVAPDRAIGFFGGPLRLLLLGSRRDDRRPQAEVCHPAGAPGRIHVDELFPRDANDAG